MNSDLDDMMRKAYRDAIIRYVKERSAYDRDSEAYKALSKVIEEYQESLAYLQYKEPR